MATYDPGVHAGGGDYMCLHRNENLLIPESWTAGGLRAHTGDVRLPDYPEADSGAVRAALADRYSVTANNVYVGNGADGVLADLLVWLRPRYAALSVLDVSFKVYPLLAHRYGYELRTVPGETFRTGAVDADECSGLTLIDSPNAITGARVAPDVVPALAAKPGSFAIWDNVYGEFAGDTLPASLPPNVAVVRSFSKFYGLAGVRVGYCIAHPDIIDGLLSVKDAFPVNSVAQTLALAALARHAEFEAAAATLLGCRDAMIQGLRRLGFVVDHEAAANYVLTRHEGVDAERLQQLLKNKSILVRRFAGDPTGNYLRITVPPMVDVERLLRTLQAILADPAVST